MAHLYMGKTLLKMDQPTDAVISLEKAVALNRTHVKTRSLLGHTYYQMMRYEDAAAHLTVVVKTKPTLDYSLVTLGCHIIIWINLCRRELYLKMAKRFSRVTAKWMSCLKKQKAALPRCTVKQRKYDFETPFCLSEAVAFSVSVSAQSRKEAVTKFISLIKDRTRNACVALDDPDGSAYHQSQYP
ncbi:hypothetical protein CHS0354_018520 [Potamilus streckersoni]|uniref:Uncharacterized protein n=1 Tax=Potamilus streckersoni TaxID=2493646 RepID=A0AAE0TAS5_9BIVA|nr:hypothetical protein CHS0354_018520 [Potamilus streckersoni]